MPSCVEDDRGIMSGLTLGLVRDGSAGHLLYASPSHTQALACRNVLATAAHASRLKS
jgi:hypothetical protein